MLNRRRVGVGVLTTATLVAALALSACGGGGGSGATSTPAQAAPTEAATAAPSAAAGGSPSAGATGSATGAATTGADGSTVLTLRAENITFDKTTLTAPAGAVTIVLDNRDTGVSHNVHVYKGSDSSGASLGMTDVAVGPNTQQLKVTLTPGTYFYECDVHPGQMKGTITVS